MDPIVKSVHSLRTSSTKELILRYILLWNIIYIYIYIFIHSFSSVSYDRSNTSPLSAIQSFLLQMRVSSPFLKVMQQLLTSSSSSSCHFYSAFYLSFNNLLQKAVSTQNVTNPVSLPFTYFIQDIPLILDCKYYFFISHMIYIYIYIYIYI